MLAGAPRVQSEQQRHRQVQRDLAYARRLQAAEVAGTQDAQACRDFEYALRLQLAENAAVAACLSPTGAAAAPACVGGRGSGAREAPGPADARREDDVVLLGDAGGLSGEGRDGDCDEDVCPDVHDMFRYFDEIYFGYVRARRAVRSPVQPRRTRADARGRARTRGARVCICTPICPQ